MGRLFTVYYLAQLPLIHPYSHHGKRSLSTFTIAPLILSAIWLRFTTTDVYSKLFLPLLFFFCISSSPPYSLPILICSMVFHCVLFVSP